MSSLTSKDFNTFDAVYNDEIYINDDLTRRIEFIVEEKLEEALKKRNLMNNVDLSTQAKIQLLFGQDVYIIPKGQ